MKLRLHNDSIRIRLNQGEVSQLAAGRRVEQATSFAPSAQIISSVEPVASVNDLKIEFDGTRLAIKVPTIRAIRWAQSDDVGIESHQPIDSARSLHILIEKDFECLHGEASENEDAFPNPLAEQK